MKITSFEVGVSYNYNLINTVEEVLMLEHGEPVIGEHAIHLQDISLDYNVWFIYDGWTQNGGTFRCVYAE